MDMRNPISWWIVIAVIFFIIEIVSPTIFVFACFGVGALAAALAVWLGANVWLTWAIFIAVSVIGIVLSRPLAEKMGGKSARLAHVDAIIGQQGRVIKTIDPQKNEGQVLVAKEDWRADAAEKIEEGQTIEVLKVEGTHLIVKKV